MRPFSFRYRQLNPALQRSAPIQNEAEDDRVRVTATDVKS